jgi:succinyl-CoA synthetase alpha subunit
MAILIDRDSKVLVQGITGAVGAFQTNIMREYGTNVVAGVTPGKGGGEVDGVPVYDLVEEAVRDHQINAAICFVPARFAREAAFEVIESGVGFLVLPTEGIPERDVVAIMDAADANNVRIIGPDTPGLISPGKSKLGVHPQAMFMEGPVGLVSKSGSLSYEVGRLLTASGFGQSTIVGIGGGPIWGTTQIEALKLFENDPETEAVVMLGEVGGRLEHVAADFIAGEMAKPVVALIVGRTAPEGTQMGHAGAIIEGIEGTAQSKIEALKAAGAIIANSSNEIPELLGEIGIQKNAWRKYQSDNPLKGVLNRSIKRHVHIH